MADKLSRTTAGTAVSTGGSLISDARLKHLYATMQQCRMVTERACRLRGQPQAASLYGASMGQEAIATGCAIDLRPGDTIALAPRNAIPALVKLLTEGAPLDRIVAQLYQKRPLYEPSSNILPPGPAQINQALYVARVNKGKKKDNVTVAFGDKHTSTSDGWRKALKLAATQSLPIIFVIEDNPWADPAVLDAEEEEEDLAGKTQNDGLPIITVDANDVVAVYRVAYESLQRLRQGGGPVLVEAKPYRLHPPAKQRVADGASWRTRRDPLIHMERYLKTKGLFTARWKEQVVDEFSQKLNRAVKAAQKARRTPPQ